MKNLAGVQLCDIDIALELQEAGVRFERAENTRSEIPYHLIGKLGYWTFRRTLCYWVVTASDGRGIPESRAGDFNKTWFRYQVRVQGCAGHTDVKTWLSSRGTIDTYHIDTQEGLNAFVAMARD